MKQVRWGICGTGEIANRFARAVRHEAVTNATLAGVCSRTQAGADAFAKKHDIPMAFGSYEAMAQFEDIDAVYIATPHALHCPNGILFMQHGKAVLSEKPVTCNLQELEKMLACAKENDVFFMEGMWSRLVPGIIKLKELVDGGVIGRVREIQGTFSYDMRDEPNHHAFQLAYGGGSLLDVGCYALHFAYLFAQDPVEIKAVADMTMGNGTDDRCYMLLRYADGTVANLCSGMTLQRPSDGWLFGEDGYIYLERFYVTQRFIVYKDGAETAYDVPYLGNGFEHEILDASACILAGKKESSFVPHSQSIAMMRQIDAIRTQVGIVYPPQED